SSMARSETTAPTPGPPPGSTPPPTPDSQVSRGAPGAVGRPLRPPAPGGYAARARRRTHCCRRNRHDPFSGAVIVDFITKRNDGSSGCVGVVGRGGGAQGPPLRLPGTSSSTRQCGDVVGLDASAWLREAGRVRGQSLRRRRLEGQGLDRAFAEMDVTAV